VSDGAKPTSRLWSAIDALIDRAPSVDDLRSHRLEVLAGRRLRARGLTVPEDFAAQERFAGIASLTAPLLLERVAGVVGVEAIVLKGPEAAAFYPDSTLRGFGDVDLLVREPLVVQRALRAAGFELVGEPELYVDIHHLRPLAVPGIPLALEVHSRPKWVEPLFPPPVDELFEAAVPGTTGVDGMLRLPAAHHALLLAVHSWAHEPLRRLHDLIDVAAVAAQADRAEIDALARRWGVAPLWRTTIAAADAMFAGGARPLALRLWAQNLVRVRERTVLENHLQRWLSDFWALSPRTALRRVPQTFAYELGPEGGEGWRAKLGRAGLAVRNASRRRSHHDRELEARSREDEPQASGTKSTSTQ
jgi:hypothetical protein